MSLPVLSSEERAFLQALVQHKVRFMIVGLTSAVLQGAHAVTQDIDLWIEDLNSESFKNAVKDANGFYIPGGIAGLNPPMLGPRALCIFDLVTHMHGLEDFSVEFTKAKKVEIAGVPLKLLPLERIIASKEAAARDKDKAVLPLLRAALALKREENKQSE